MKFNNETLKDAVEEWIIDSVEAELKYGHISSWDTSKVTDMICLFQFKNSFNEDIGNWNVSKVNDMTCLFCNCFDFNQDISGWDVSNVKKMGGMFQGTKSFNQDIGNWDVSSVTDMGYMFDDTLSFNQDISKWDLSNVSEINKMFNSANKNMIEKYGENGEWFVEKFNIKKSSKKIIKINKDTLVTQIGPFESSIKLEAFVKILNEVFGAEYDLDELIQEYDDCGWIEDDDFILDGDDSGLSHSATNRLSQAALVDILEKVFKEVFYCMDSDRFYLTHSVDETKLNIDGFDMQHIPFVVSGFSSSDDEHYMDQQITKDHHERNLTELKDKNFLSKDEMILFNRLDQDDKVERYYNARYSYYYMKKKDFNREKWWLGWILE
tara:strand:- start:42 stop:1181 length:1140 start_codon:yes stop_codon:yes gene_type:complete